MTKPITMTSPDQGGFPALPGDIVLFIDPHRKSPKRDGFNQTGVVLPDQQIVFIRAARVTEIALEQLKNLPGAALMRPSIPGLPEKLAAFFSRYRRSPRLVALGLQALQLRHYAVFESTEIMPVFRTVPTQAAHDVAWHRAINKLRPGDLVCIFEHKSFIDWLIARLDHGAWSHATLYVGNGLVVEAVPGQGVVERSLDVYDDRCVRLGIYRDFRISEEMSKRGIEAARRTIGHKYAWHSVIILGVHKLFARLILRDRAVYVSSGTTPNDVVYSGGVALVDYV